MTEPLTHTLSDDTLDELRELLANATAGPWKLHPHSHLEAHCRCMSCYGPTTVWQTSNGLDCDDVPSPVSDSLAEDSGERCDRSGFTYTDAALIAALRNAAPALLAAVAAHRAAEQRVRALCERAEEKKRELFRPASPVVVVADVPTRAVLAALDGSHE